MKSRSIRWKMQLRLREEAVHSNNRVIVIVTVILYTDCSEEVAEVCSLQTTNIMNSSNELSSRSTK